MKSPEKKYGRPPEGAEVEKKKKLLMKNLLIQILNITIYDIMNKGGIYIFIYTVFRIFTIKKISVNNKDG